MTRGSVVQISYAEGPHSTVTVQGVVRDCLMLHELPDVPEAPAVGKVQELLDGALVDYIAAISYPLEGQEVVFVALHRIDGAWYDLQSQLLHITEVAFAPGGLQ